jgi:(5-formylfuran-3-yl)methyl phosphate synthase
MQLLVSVRSAEEASAALAGGADLIDAKDPTAGALASVSRERFRAIAVAVAAARPLSAALGDAADEAVVERTARAFVGAGAAFVKTGFAGISNADRVAALIAAAVRGAAVCAARSSAAVVAAAYADADRAGSIARDRLIDIAAVAGARGVLLDTFDKRAGGLRDLIRPRDLAAWVDAAHNGGLFVALAGRLTAGDLPFVYDAGADIAGVRGAACDGGRADRVSAARVRDLKLAFEGAKFISSSAPAASSARR